MFLKKTMGRREFFTASSISIAAAAAAAAGSSFEVPSLVGSAAAATPEPIGDPIHIGFLGALSGPDAGWGLPGLTGNQIFIDRVNAEGGLLVGAERRPLKMFAFDDEATGSKALQGAKQLVLENDVKFISAASTISRPLKQPGSAHRCPPPLGEKPISPRKGR